ncbi:hypothetical protein GCM10007857_82850 [Bradyrhizobium iriomotense]|uniref:Uncharacterized protein n=1 Tax=Bradyrhizobium iriomotense TaxID=441950 RepID=A0ABQ6BB34_9BRAD|nr:hypothetical protein GCM10007857_82850 [Bradyrhizobium iriomotense]
MRKAVIAAITSAAMMRCRRAAPSGLAVMSGAVVTAALFPDLGGGVNVRVDASFSAVVRPHAAQVIGRAVLAWN